MEKTFKLFLITAVVGSLNIGPGFAQTPSADEVVTTLEKLNGVTPGARRNHIRGVCASGTFVGSKTVQFLSKSALFSGKSIPVIARFSLAGGNPNAPDTARSPRGLAIEFKLPKGNVHHFTMLNVPVFSASSLQTFLDALNTNLPDPQTGKPDPLKIQAFRESHPDAKPLAEFMSKNNPPVSYGNSNFFSVHTFKFINQKNKTTLVRWRFEPEAGVQRLSDDELKTAPARFLDEDLINKTKQAPLKWKMILTVGEPGDEQNNPTVYWPAERQELEAGVLTLNAATPQVGAPCENVNFDPLVMAEGVAPTDDPVLLFRSPAYASSYVKRLTGK
jgi:catalase